MSASRSAGGTSRQPSEPFLAAAVASQNAASHAVEPQSRLRGRGNVVEPPPCGCEHLGHDVCDIGLHLQAADRVCLDVQVMILVQLAEAAFSLCISVVSTHLLLLLTLVHRYMLVHGRQRSRTFADRAKSRHRKGSDHTLMRVILPRRRIQRGPAFTRAFDDAAAHKERIREIGVSIADVIGNDEGDAPPVSVAANGE
jgi:hypothetical protein